MSLALEKLPSVFCVARRGCSGVNDKVLHILGGASKELLTFDPDSVADLLPSFMVTVFHFLGRGFMIVYFTGNAVSTG